ncbi:hypothetical protein IG631_02524 [Alternaria alternata]|nr:hypothetical protein IG631_02524 [Alternaria alternata]
MAVRPSSAVGRFRCFFRLSRWLFQDVRCWQYAYVVRPVQPDVSVSA